MKEQIKELRIEIDGLAQLTKELKGDLTKEIDIKFHGEDFVGFPTKETKKATDSLYLAKAWLGKILGELEEETPYKNDGKRKTVEDIEPVAGRTDFPYYYFKSKQELDNKNHIEKVDWLREEIKKVADVVLELNGGKLNRIPFTEYQEKLQWNSYTYLCEARFWLGFELGRIRNEQKTN